jgi:hypothetical protein
MPTLLQIAKAFRPQQTMTSPVSQEEIELSIAWLQGEVNDQQVNSAFSNKHGSATKFLILRALKEAYVLGRLHVR